MLTVRFLISSNKNSFWPESTVRTSVDHTLLGRLQNNLEKLCQCNVAAVGGVASHMLPGNYMLLSPPMS